MRRPKVIMSLLEDFFNLTHGCVVEFFRLLGGKSGRFGGGLKEYKYGQFGLTIRKYVNAELTYLCFLEEYANMVSKWFEVFSCLIDMLGSKEYHRILFGDVQLEEAIDTSEIDINFLKFRIRNFLNPSLSDLEEICGSLLEKSQNVLEQVNQMKVKSTKMLIKLIENQARGWLLLYGELQNSLQVLSQVEDKIQMVSTLTLIAQRCTNFFEKIKQTRKYMKVSNEVSCNFVYGGFIDFPSLSKKLREDMTELFNYLMKIFKHLVNCFLNILTTLWGEKAAQSKVEDFIKSKISAKELIPKNLSIKDLTFGLTLARSELGQAQLASQGLDEKRIAIDILENNLPKIEDLQILLNRITKILELKEKYLYKINDIMIDLQKILQQRTEPEKLIFGT